MRTVARSLFNPMHGALKGKVIGSSPGGTWLIFAQKVVWVRLSQSICERHATLCIPCGTLTVCSIDCASPVSRPFGPRLV